ncbi:YceI family protein [Solitalea koreensis]|uniref:YceI-like domain-containing protein n=1 Tax=Solitalea koreensis TaxID=543615 RepID=A0A521AKC6_9SPHI|nr:YceI family protein [Solitalea koreensis]SMO35256.1 YceI-like domain-containing protein [Solitalea koreensis]
MKKIGLCIAIIIMSIQCYAQMYTSNATMVSFYSKTPMEDIEAINSTAATLLNTANDSIYVRMKNTAFKFKSALMQEHFNENYMESSKYPLSTFRGKINEQIDFSKNGSYVVSATGKMIVHGVEQLKTITGTINIKEGKISINSSFKVKPPEFNIEIPSLVFTKIAEEITVKLVTVLALMDKM